MPRPGCGTLGRSGAGAAAARAPSLQPRHRARVPAPLRRGFCGMLPGETSAPSRIPPSRSRFVFSSPFLPSCSPRRPVRHSPCGCREARVVLRRCRGAGVCQAGSGSGFASIITFSGKKSGYQKTQQTENSTVGCKCRGLLGGALVLFLFRQRRDNGYKALFNHLQIELLCI